MTAVPEPSDALIEAIRAIGREHRIASMSVPRMSCTCACGVESMEWDGLERHRAELAAAAMVEHLGLRWVDMRRDIMAREPNPRRRLVSRWEQP